MCEIEDADEHDLFGVIAGLTTRAACRPKTSAIVGAEIKSAESICMPDETPLPTGYQLSAHSIRHIAKRRGCRSTGCVQADPVHHDQQLGRFFLTRGKEVSELIKNRELNADPRKANEGSFSKTLVRQ